jgi:very-short-patch-repair endonuclease
VDVASLLRRQHGVVSRDQARHCGWSDDRIDRMLRNGDWTRLLPRVYLTDSAPRSWMAMAFAATLSLGPDAVLVAETAAALRALVEQRLPVAVAIAPGRRVRLTSADVRVLRLDVSRSERVTISGLPTTTRLRTAIDLAHLLPDVQAQPIVDRMLVLDTVDLDELTDAVSRSSRKGSARARALMRSAADLAAAESERRALRVFRDAGITGWSANLRVQVRGGRTIKVDLALPALRIAVEIKGWQFHAASDRAQKDDTRVTDLQLAGWLVIPVGWLELQTDPEGVVAKVMAAIAARRMSP